ncbi:fimbrillin family protein [Parabacteroides sp.]
MKTKSLVSGTAALALSALLFTSCSSEDDPTPAISSQYVTIAPSISDEVITKAGSAYGETGDKLYLYYNTAGNTTADQFADFRYDGTIWDLGITKMKWTTLHDAVSGNSIPFYATAPVQAPTTVTKVEADQSSTAGYKNSDLLVAYKAVAKATDGKYNALDIDMKHVLAKLTIDVNAKAIEDAVINSVTIKDAVLGYKVTYSSSEDTPATTKVDGNTTAEIKPLVNGTVYSAVLPAQAIQKTAGITIIISVNDKTFTYQPTDAINLQQGKNTTLKLRLSGTGVALGDVTVSEWGEGDTTSGNIEEDPQP